MLGEGLRNKQGVALVRGYEAPELSPSSWEGDRGRRMPQETNQWLRKEAQPPEFSEHQKAPEGKPLPPELSQGGREAMDKEPKSGVGGGGHSGSS